MAPPKKVVNWLYTVLQPQYLHKDIAYAHIYRFLLAYLPQGFRIRTAVFTSSNGVPQLLINIYGTLGADSGPIPLNIWIPFNYPFADDGVGPADANGVPLVFVVPDSSHTISPSNCLDRLGRFYHPFLSSWHHSCVPGRPIDQFSLLLLMSCLLAVFKHEYPLVARELPPLLPPKPEATPAASRGAPGGDNTANGPPPAATRQTTGPPLPEKPKLSLTEKPKGSGTPLTEKARGSGPSLPEKPVNYGPPLPEKPIPVAPEAPQKYRSPLPLPEEYTPRFMLHKPISPLQHQAFPVYSERPPEIPKPTVVPEVEDLMDKMTLDSPNGGHNGVLDEISEKINQYIASGDSIYGKKPYVDEHTQKVEALRTQLESHTRQAEANDENLSKHIVYLQGKIGDISESNRQLEALAQINGALPTLVQTLADEKLRLSVDELMTPDSALVNQLYEVVADIKAHQDTINLISGYYDGESELISDANMETCVKNVRALGRELFWLKMMRRKIGGSMGLDI